MNSIVEFFNSISQLHTGREFIGREFINRELIGRELIEMGHHHNKSSSICKLSFIMIRFSSLEIILFAFNFSELIQAVNTLQFRTTDTLYSFLRATFNRQSTIEPSAAAQCALEQQRKEFGKLIEDDGAALNEDVSPTVVNRALQSREVKDYYKQNSAAVENAAMTIIRSTKFKNLFYAFSAHIQPDPQPQRLLQDEVIHYKV